MEVIIGLVVTAIVKLLDLLNQKQWMSAGKIVLAAVVGTLAGIFGINGLDWMTGLQMGLAASGAVTIAGYAGSIK